MAANKLKTSKLNPSPGEPWKPSERDSLIYQLRCRGISLREIAAKVKLSAERVRIICEKVEKWWLANNSHDVGRFKVRDSERLEHIYDEAMAAWQRSKEKAQALKVTTENRNIIALDDLTPQPNGEPLEPEQLNQKRKRGRPVGKSGKTVRTKESKSQSGDPRYLSIAMEAMRDRRKIWGIDAPEPNPHADNQLDRVAGKSVEEVVQNEIVKLQNRLKTVNNN